MGTAFGSLSSFVGLHRRSLFLAAPAPKIHPPPQLRGCHTPPWFGSLNTSDEPQTVSSDAIWAAEAGAMCHDGGASSQASWDRFCWPVSLPAPHSPIDGGMINPPAEAAGSVLKKRTRPPRWHFQSSSPASCPPRMAPIQYRSLLPHQSAPTATCPSRVCRQQYGGSEN